jgi:hypothetical protein
LKTTGPSLFAPGFPVKYMPRLSHWPRVQRTNGSVSIEVVLGSQPFINSWQPFFVIEQFGGTFRVKQFARMNGTLVENR